MAPFDPPTRSHRIAAALLDVLAATGDAAGRGRVVQALGGDEAGLRVGRAPVSEARLATAFRAVPVDRGLARRVGRAVVASSGLGLFVRYSGFAGPEKALRRCDALLARECEPAEYRAEAIDDGRARVHFQRGEPPQQSAGDDAPFCGVREGMLEALPSLFGLPLARVREVACTTRGAPECVFEVRWRRAPRRGLVTGALAGVGLGGVLAVAAGAGPVPGVLFAIGMAVLGAGAGRSFDLAEQLDILSARRREQASWVQDAEGQISARIDELAKLDALLDGRGGERTNDALLRGDGDGAPAHRPASRLRLTDLSAVVERAVQATAGETGGRVRVEVSIETEESAIRCDAFQIEQMLLQLLRNALHAASAGGGRVGIRLAPATGGLELVVEDDGPGIDEEIVERLFDPFAPQPAAGIDGGFGLPVSYRIVQAHGGELRVESEPGEGTRVFVFLPGEVQGPGAAL